MSNSNKSNSGGAASGGVSSVGVVQIVFLILKLCKTAPIGNWPWWKVMLPVECSVGLMCSLFCCGAGCGVIALCFSKDDNVTKPGTVLTEEELRIYEKSLEKIVVQTELQSNDSLDSFRTSATSLAKHSSKQVSINEKNQTIVDEGSDNNV